jgi:hypothetical protein
VTRRPVLPGASELFRRTDTAPEPEVVELPSISTTTSSPALRATSGRRTEETAQPLTLVPGGAAPAGDELAAFRAAASAAPAVPAPSAVPLTRGRPQRGRVERAKHDEKITVYISADELVALESARLVLRAQHGLAADRGRIVREAVAVILADLEERGEDSVLVRRLRS